VITDTSALLAFFNTAEPAHDAVRAAVESATEPLVVSPFVIAELDYLLATKIGVAAELVVLNELASGAYELPSLDAADLASCAAVVEKYRDQEIGVADASLVVLADRYRTRTVLTLDRRHFGVLRSLQGKKLLVVP
jgi:predicted nucleic acid-binding protein